MIARRVFAFAWWSIAGVVVTLAVTLSAARLLLPGMSEYRIQLQSVAQRVLKRPVSIASLDAAWHGLSPVLKLNRVIVSDKRFPDGKLGVDEVHVALDIIESLRQRQWITAGVRLIGIRLSLQTNLLNRGAKQQDFGSLTWLLLQESIVVEDVQLDWSDPGLFESPVKFTELSLQLVNEGDRHQFSVQTDLPESLGNTLKVAADLRGTGTDFQTWRGRVYLKTENLALAAAQHLFPDVPIVVNGSLDLELWAGIRNLQAQWGSGSFALRAARFENATADAQAITADSLSSRFHWRTVEQGWKVGLNGLELQRDARTTWPSTDVQLAIGTASGLTVEGGMTLVVLEELNALLPLIPWVDTDALAMVDRLQPQGLLHDAGFRFSLVEGAAPAFAARAKMENLQFAANGGLPGVRGLSGSIEGNLQSGNLYLQSGSASLAIPKMFPTALEFEQFNGVVHWQRYADLFRIESKLLTMKSSTLGLVARWQLDWPYAQSLPWLDMQLALDDLSIADVDRYLPEKVMPPKAVAWLQRALVSGIVTDARVLLQGRLDQMPFDHHEGRFEARFDFEDTVLDFHPTWGQIDGVGGTAVFTGRSMNITGTTGHILESPVERVVAVIKDLKKPLLEIRGTAGGTLAGMLEYTSSSPLGARFGHLINVMDSSGDARLQLELDIPLKPDLGKVRVSGDVVLDSNDLVPKNGGIGLTDIHGTLHFTGAGISADEASARVLGQPVLVSVYRKGKTGQSKTVVDIDGKLKLIERMRKTEFVLAPYISGATRWHALLNIQNQPGPGTQQVELELRSDLKGVAIDLPEPFKKSPTDSRDLRIRWVPGQESVLPFAIRYADIADAQMLLAAGARNLRKLHVRFNGGVAQLPEDDVIHLSGHVDELDLGRWIPVFSSAPAGRAKPPPLTVDLFAENFYLASARVKNIQATSNVPDPWYFKVEGEGASGWVRWSFADKAIPARLMANLQYLVVSSREPPEGSERTGSMRPQALPEMNVNVAKLNWDERNLGGIKVVAKRTPQGIEFETLDMDSKAIVFKGSGAWLERDGRQSSHFNAVIQGGELGELARLLRTGSTVKGGKLDGSIQLSWPGSPVDFSLATVEAEFDLSAKNGRLVSVDEGGAGKLLSLFSLNTLQRRLTLDFSDVFKEGFTFDKMQGHFVVMDGDAFTNDFTIKGSSAMIDIAGRTGLVARDYDQLVTVTPQVSSTLPIAGAIAGGPAVGAAVFIADKLVGDKFNRMTRIQYQVTGSWDKPEYKKLEQ
ncbi:MAG: YhdP family protein [Gammaproteobacteria bacterium]|nr:MAG: YhdP family protein [Gammaproteobacteria bacterium]